MIHDMIVPIQPDPNRPARAAEDYALSLASVLGAKLTGMVPSLGPTLVGILRLEIPTELFEQIQSRSEEDAKTGVKTFEERARAAGVLQAHALAHAGLFEFVDVFLAKARICDLSILPQPETASGAWETDLFQAVLLGSGRPVLVVPYIQRGEARLDNVLVAWDGSKEAARAVHDALPLLQRAKTVEVLTVETEAHGGAEAITGTDLARHLVGHGLPATARSMTGVDIDVSDALLSHAADSGVNLIVMGGYAHSRLRDLVFGGATLGMLNSMTVPVLMSH